MMTYTVKIRRGFWRRVTLRNVKGDGILDSGKHRYFICNDETRYEIPIEGSEFRFSKERFLVVKQNMERQLGQSIPVHP